MHELLFSAALRDFRDARRKAALQDIIARLTGKSEDLLPYEETSRLLKVRGTVEQGLHEIPLDAIVGSVGRYNDFNRSFLPRRDIDQERWAKVKLKTVYQGGLPPIEVYKIGEAYFVIDGNHRVSVARSVGASHIQGYVTEVETRVPLTPDASLDDLIIKAKYGEFLERTELDRARPGMDLTVTVPGQYRVLEDQILAFRRRLALRKGEEVSLATAAAVWYDEVYLPVVEVIRKKGILREFPGRTETDLFVWVSNHRESLEQQLGWIVDPAVAASDLAARAGDRSRPVMARLGEKLRDALDAEGPAARLEADANDDAEAVTDRNRRLFADILVVVGGKKKGWRALEQALVIAQREEAELFGLHVVDSVRKTHSAHAQAVAAEFRLRCQATGMPATITIRPGKVAKIVARQAAWSDLVVAGLSEPPGEGPVARLGSGLRRLIQGLESPLLAVPGSPSKLSAALLAYDASPKAEEALYIATYLAGRWQIPLTVVTVSQDGSVGDRALTEARTYLEARGVDAAYLGRSGPVATAILEAADEQGSDLLIVGGYGLRPVMEVMLGSTVDQLLRRSRHPVLICR